MNIIILCAGSGRRIDIDKPKCLLKINGKTILDRTLNLLRKNNQKNKNIIFALGYKNNMIKKIIKNKYNYFINKKYAQTNMVYSLFGCLSKIKIADTVILYGDIYYTQEIIDKILKSKNDITTAIDKNWKMIWKLKDNFHDDLETLKIKKNKITEIGGKTNEISSIDGRYIGATKFNKKTINFFIKFYSKKIKLGSTKYTKLDMTSLLMIMIKKGYKLSYKSINSFWYEFDNKKDIEIFDLYESKFKNKKS